MLEGGRGVRFSKCNHDRPHLVTRGSVGGRVKRKEGGKEGREW